jgi:hypothetical protein
MMSDDEDEPDDDGLEPWSRHGPATADLAERGAEFLSCTPLA